MPLINIDPYITVGRLKEMFQKETGLDLQINFLQDHECDDTLLGYMELNNFSLCKEPCSINSHFIHFKYGDTVTSIKTLLSRRLQCEISDSAGVLNDSSKLSDYIPDDMKHRDIQLTDEANLKANALNEQLIKIEKDIYSKWLEIKDSLDQKLNDDNDWLDDYEIELSIDYYIDSSDHIYDENAENLLLNVTRSLPKDSWTSLINDGYHHDCRHVPSGFKFPVCFLYHELYENYYISHYDMQRIGRIRVDIRVVHQYDYRLDTIEKPTQGITENFLVKINTNQTFDNYFVYPENKRAHTLSQIYVTTCDNTGKSLVIYGDPGTGKTHLLNAIMHLTLQNKPGLKIKYLTAYDFFTEFIDSIRFNTQPEFKKKFRVLDLLIIDDFDIMETKEETQNEFYFLMNSLLLENRSVIISSYKNPLKLDTLNSRIKATIEHGLITRLQHPDLDSRIEFIDSDLFDPGMEITDIMRTKIAHNIKTIGALKGFAEAIKTLHSPGSDITNELIEDEMKNYVQGSD